MHRSLVRPRPLVLLGCLVWMCGAVATAEINPSVFNGMRGRSIGPYRIGRVLAVSNPSASSLTKETRSRA
jgi:hypothetical protein